MRLLIHSFDPSACHGEREFLVPAGAEPLSARMTHMGIGQIVFAVQDDAQQGVDNVAVLFVWENDAKHGGDVAGWHQIGSWMYSNGLWQHCFRRVVIMPPKARRGLGRLDSLTEIP